MTNISSYTFQKNIFCPLFFTYCAKGDFSSILFTEKIEVMAVVMGQILPLIRRCNLNDENDKNKLQQLFRSMASLEKPGATFFKFLNESIGNIKPPASRGVVPESWREECLDFAKDVAVNLLEYSANWLDSLKKERVSSHSQKSMIVPNAGVQKKHFERTSCEVKRSPEVRVMAAQNKRQNKGVKKVSFFDEVCFSNNNPSLQEGSSVTNHKKKRVK